MHLPHWLATSLPGLLLGLLVVLGGPVLLYLQVTGLALLVVAGVVGAAAAVAIWARPQAAFLLALALGASVFPEAPKYLTFGPVHTDLVEVIVLLLLTRAVLGWLAAPTLGAPLRGPLLLLLAASTVGAYMAYKHGSGVNEATRWWRLFLFYLLPLVTIPLFPGPEGRATLSRGIRWIATASCVVTVAAAATGTPLDAAAQGLGSTQAPDVSSVTTLGATSEVLRIRPAVIPLLAVAIFLLLADAKQRGWTLGRVTQLLLFVAVELVSFNRSSWVPLIGCAVLFYLLVQGDRGIQTRNLLIGIPVALALSLLLVNVALDGHLGTRGTAVAERIASTVTPSVAKESSFQDRTREDEHALDTLRSEWLLGNGIGRPYGSREIVPKASTGGTEVVNSSFIHNSYLGLALDLGVLGLVAVGLVAAAVVRRTVRARRDHLPGSLHTFAVALAFLSLAASSTFQTNLHFRPAMLTWTCALTLIFALQRPDDAATADTEQVPGHVVTPEPAPAAGTGR